MPFTYEKTFSGFFALDKKKLEKISQFLGQRGFTLSDFELKCSDGAQLSGNNINHLVDFPNSDQSKLTRIKLKFTSDREKSEVVIIFAEGTRGSLTLALSSETYDECLSLRERLLEIIAMSKGRSETTANLLGAFQVVGGIGLLLGSFTGGIVLLDRAGLNTSTLSVGLWFFLAIAITVFIIKVVSFIRPKLALMWPTSLFLIGQGMDRFEQGKYLRRNLLYGSIIVPLIIAALIFLVERVLESAS